MRLLSHDDWQAIIECIGDAQDAALGIAEANEHDRVIYRSATGYRQRLVDLAGRVRTASLADDGSGGAGELKSVPGETGPETIARRFSRGPQS